MDEALRKRLENPEAKYLGKPFWSWNGDLRKEELLRQIEVMKEMGFGGFFMHSRTGLITEYMGEKWFSLIRACAEYGNKLGMEAWLYDEDRWPSGTCGGLVTKNREYRLRFISEYDDEEKAAQDENVVRILRRYALLFEGEKLKDAREVNGKEEVPTGYEYKVYAEELMAESAFYNGAAYLDTMNEEATEAFFQSTLDKYGAECGDLLGKEIFGVFTDEPHRGAIFSGFGISNENKDKMTPYTGDLFTAYRNKYGRELCIPELYYFREGEDENRTAAEYIDVLDDLFTHNFAEKYAERCKRLKLKFTGHILHEDSLDFQTAVSGSMMRFYEYMDYPGIDNLSAHNGCYWAAIQCASVARQLNKPFVLSELYGCTGWDMPLNEYKRIGDWQAIFGVNLRCPHLSWYSMKGEAKRDYPASILHQNAWWRDWKELETYFGRIGIILSEGERKSGLLVIHPVENMWKRVRKGWQKNLAPMDGETVRLNEAFQRQCLDLIAAQHEFDYGDEELMKKYGSVGKDGNGAFLKIGGAIYRTVLVAEGQEIRESTRRLLEKFRKLGGRVVCRVDELACGEVVSAPEGVASAIRRIAGETWLFLMNLSETEKSCGKVELNAELSALYAEEWDMVDYCPRGTADLNNLSFEAGEMKIFLLKKEGVEEREEPFACALEIPEKTSYALSEPNVLVLDRVRCHADIAGFEEDETDVLLLDRRLREKFGLEPRGGEMIQPWYAEKFGGSAEGVLARLRLEYVFDSEIEAEVGIAAEYDALSVNGIPATLTNRFWVDTCFKVFSAKIKKGRNVVSVSLNFQQSENLEAVYVLGEFGVKLPNTVTALPKKISSEAIEGQGFPFYGGAISFYTGINGKNVTVAVEELHGADVHISDGRQEKIIAFPPYTKTLNLQGELIVTLNCTRRNTFGPHHLVPYPQYAYGPDAWVSEGNNRTEAYTVVRQGWPSIPSRK